MPSKYDAFNNVFRLGKCETKALLYLKYGEDPESMDYKALQDVPPLHDRFSPVPSVQIAKNTGCCKTGMYIALKECFFRGVVSRRGMGNASRGHKELLGYFLDYDQNKLITDMEQLAVEFCDIKKR